MRASDRQSVARMNMEELPLRSLLKMLLQAASTIQDCDLARLHVPVATFLFLHRLARHCDHSAKPLGEFLALISASQLADEIIRGFLPAEFDDVRTELERLQGEKEAAIANQDWERARTLLDHAGSLKERVREAGPDAIEIQPDHILQAIARLGYDQPIIV